MCWTRGEWGWRRLKAPPAPGLYLIPPCCCVRSSQPFPQSCTTQRPWIPVQRGTAQVTGQFFRVWLVGSHP